MFISVLYEDADCLVINKPAGMPCHVLKTQKNLSALEILGERYPEVLNIGCDFGDNLLEGGLVHRLDTGTSGILVFARNQTSYENLREAFSNHKISKSYIAVCEGEILKKLEINYKIAHHPKNKAKMLAILPKNKYFRGKAKEAVTWIWPFGGKSEMSFRRRPESRNMASELDSGLRRNDVSFLNIKIQGGRRHQIRVHLASIGHPLVGDTLYGAQINQTNHPKIKNHMLHANWLKLPKGKEIFSDYPDAWRDWLQY